MRILIYEENIVNLLTDSSFVAGGSTIQLKILIHALASDKVKIGIVTSSSTSESNIIQYFSGNVEIIKAFDAEKGYAKIRWLTYRIPMLVKAVKKYDPDYILQSCAGFTTGVIAFVSRICGVPLIYRAANNTDSDQGYKKILPGYARLSFEYGLNNSDYIICQNNYQAKNFKRSFPKKNIRVIHNAYNSLSSTLLNKDFHKLKYVAWLGLFQYQKNLPALFEIAKKLPDIKFKIAGESKPDLDNETKEALVKLQKCKNVVFEGYLRRDKVSHFLRNAILLLNTSRYEGFSNTFLESFAVGTPAVVLKKNDPDSIIETNGLGLVSEEYSGIPKLIENMTNYEESVYKNISRSCIEYVTREHDPIKLSKTLFQFLNNN